MANADSAPRGGAIFRGGVLLSAAVLILWGCSAATGTATDTFELTVTATGEVGLGGFDITITDESAATVLATASGSASPAVLSAGGTIDFSTTQTIEVSVTGNLVPPGDSMTVTVTYTEKSYLPPVTRTVSTATRTNSGAVDADLEYQLPLALPLN